jgi:CBS domain-containing protein
VLSVIIPFTSGWVPLEQLSVANGSFLQRLMAVNVILVVFNMLPAFPMDGGRVLRALLATQLEYTRATQIAASIGQSMALVFGLLGFFYNPFLMFIALFVWIGAGQEAGMAQMKSSLAGIPVRRAMITEFQTLTPHDPLTRATDKILAGSQQDFPVLDDGQVVGILTRHDLLVGLTQHGGNTPVGDTMTREFVTFDSSEMLETAFRRLQTCQCRTGPVLQRGALVGLVTMENVGEFVAIQAAGRQFAAARHPPARTASD